MRRWYLLQTKPKAERLAYQHLQNQGYEVYLPELEVERIRQGRLTCAKEPMFSRYLFVHLDDDLKAASWTPIRSTRGVLDLVRFGTCYATVPDGVIDWLQTSAAAVVQSAYAQGARMTIVEGPFQGLSAIFDHFDGLERAVVLIELLSKQSAATFDLSQLKLES